MVVLIGSAYCYSTVSYVITLKAQHSISGVENAVGVSPTTGHRVHSVLCWCLWLTSIIQCCMYGVMQFVAVTVLPMLTCWCIGRSTQQETDVSTKLCAWYSSRCINLIVSGQFWNECESVTSTTWYRWPVCGWLSVRCVLYCDFFWFLVVPRSMREARLNQSGCRVCVSLSVCGNFFSDQPLSPSWFDRSRWNLAWWEVLGGSIP